MKFPCPFNGLSSSFSSSFSSFSIYIREPYWVEGRGHNDIIDGKRYKKEYYRRLGSFLEHLLDKQTPQETIEIQNVLFKEEEDEEDENDGPLLDAEGRDLRVSGMTPSVGKSLLEGK